MSTLTGRISPSAGATSEDIHWYGSRMRRAIRVTEPATLSDVSMTTDIAAWEDEGGAAPARCDLIAPPEYSRITTSVEART